MVERGDVIVLNMEDDSFLEPNGSLNVPIAFENESLVVFNKPSGMPVHPSIRHQGDTLGNYFAYLYPELTFRSVNRLDRDTSGLCIIAKDAHAAKLLQGCCKKVYYAAVHGEIPESGTIDAPIARERESIILRCVRDDGQRAVTHFKRLKTNGRYSLAEIDLETGRTHQIRVHFAHIGAPLAGDDLYGGLRDDISRQALHCGKLTFSDPMTGEPITVSSELPKDITDLFLQEE
jgi:23S rRNA pseudouridine1911/1915/1917 synthase